jgi:hypothetical protein
LKNGILKVIPVVVLLVTLSCNLLNMADDTATGQQPVAVEPQQAVVEEEPQTTAETSISQDGVTLYYDPTLILEVEASSVEASSGDEAYSTIHPAYPQFHLVMDDGTVSVVPAADLRASSPETASVLNELQGLLSAQFMPGAGECVPDVPLVAFYHDCSHQEIASSRQFINFQNGSGVRYVSVYGIQDIAPISNEHLTYVFQGFTADGKYYITVRFHILHSQLEDVVLELPEEVYTDETGAAMQAYFAREEMFLDQNQADFQPPLERLDALLQSLRIE